MENMNQFEESLIATNIEHIMSTTEKALSALKAYERAPDPLLIEIAMDCLGEGALKRLRIIAPFVRMGKDVITNE